MDLLTIALVTFQMAVASIQPPSLIIEPVNAESDGKTFQLNCSVTKLNQKTKTLDIIATGVNNCPYYIRHNMTSFGFDYSKKTNQYTLSSAFDHVIIDNERLAIQINNANIHQDLIK